MNQVYSTAENYAQNETTFSEKIVIMKNLDKMVNAEASKNFYSHFVYFKAVFYWLMPHMEIDDRKVCEADWRRLVSGELYIKRSEKNDASKSKEIEDLRRNFIESHQYYLYSTLPRASITQINEEGDLDYNKKDFDILRSVIRSGSQYMERLAANKAQRDLENSKKLENNESPQEETKSEKNSESVPESEEED